MDSDDRHFGELLPADTCNNILAARTWIISVNSQSLDFNPPNLRAGYILWPMVSNAKLAIGDHVYLYLRDINLVRYYLEVIDDSFDYDEHIPCPLSDTHAKYYRIAFRFEILGEIFTLQALLNNGLPSVRSLSRPIVVKDKLLDFFQQQTPCAITYEEYDQYTNQILRFNPELSLEHANLVTLLHFALLRSPQVHFTYRKVDGTIRHAFGTNNPHTLKNKYGISEPNPNPPYPRTEGYFDYARMDWRRLRIENLLSVDEPLKLVLTLASVQRLIPTLSPYDHDLFEFDDIHKLSEHLLDEVLEKVKFPTYVNLSEYGVSFTDVWPSERTREEVEQIHQFGRVIFSTYRSNMTWKYLLYLVVKRHPELSSEVISMIESRDHFDPSHPMQDEETTISLNLETIPPVVLELAKKYGYKNVMYVHTRRGYDVYSPILNGSCPTDLPALILYRDGDARYIHDLESFLWL